jgi:hypothetical protein
MRFRGALAPHTEGLPLRIVRAGGAPALSADTAFVDVPTDFVLTSRERGG